MAVYINGVLVASSLDSDIVTGNIKAGITILGVAGSSEVINTHTESPITAGGVLLGTDGFANGSTINGTMPDNAGDNANIGTDIVTPTVLKLLAPEGYYDGVNDYVTITDADFVAANIKLGFNIFGIDGSG